MTYTIKNKEGESIMAEKGVVFRPSFYEAMRYLKDKDQAALFRAICEYGFYDQKPEGLNPTLYGFFVLTVCFILAWLIYGIVPVGHFLLIYFFAVLFVLVMSGFGLVISNYSATMQQSMFVMWFCLLVVILMSGLFTPISSMPEWAQIITIFNPLKYFMEVMRMIYLKGSGFFDLLPQFGILLLFAVVFNSWAVISYRKNN